MPARSGLRVSHASFHATSRTGARKPQRAVRERPSTYPDLVSSSDVLSSASCGSAPAAEVAHEGRNGGDQVDLTEHPLGHRQGSPDAALGNEVAVAHRGHRDEAEVHGVAARACPRGVKKGRDPNSPTHSKARAKLSPSSTYKHTAPKTVSTLISACSVRRRAITPIASSVRSRLVTER